MLTSYNPDGPRFMRRISHGLVTSVTGGGDPGGGGMDDDLGGDLDDDDDPEDARGDRDVLTLTKRQLNRRLLRASSRSVVKKYGLKDETELERLLALGRRVRDGDGDDLDDGPEDGRRRSPEKPPEKPPADDKSRELAAATAEKDRFRSIAKDWRNKAVRQQQEFEQRLADMETDAALRINAVSAGIDPEHLDLVMGRFTKYVNGLDDKQAKALDPGAWFEEHGTKYPFLLRAAKTPADTSTGGDNGDGDGGKPDAKDKGGDKTPRQSAMTMTAAEARARRAELLGR